MFRLFSLIIFLFIIWGCSHTTQQEIDTFVISGMEEYPKHLPGYEKSQEVPMVQEKIQQPLLPKDFYTIQFITPLGRHVRLFVPNKGHAIGRPNKGRLMDGICIADKGAGYVHFGRNSCATGLTVSIVMFAIGQLHKAYPDTPPVVIGSLSRPGGGPIKPHRSHQNGLDIDIGYIPADSTLKLQAFKTLPPSDIDFEKTFFLMANMIATQKVKYIFVDYTLQKYLFDAAREMGYSDEQLERLFQFPRGRYVKKGIIRYSPGHKDHFHVRFKCPPFDKECSCP